MPTWKTPHRRSGPGQPADDTICWISTRGPEAGEMDGFFGISASGSTVRREVLAGATTFMTMAYILAVNPNTLAAAGMDRGAVFVATAIASALATLVMALWARLPFVLAPGMGLNAFFAYTVVVGMGYTWQLALTAVFIEGLIFLALTGLRVREAIIGCIPMCLKRAIPAGIGLFIALLGLDAVGIVGPGNGTLLALGDLSQPPALLTLAGILIIGVLLVLRVPGALLIGIFAVTGIAAIAGQVDAPSGWGAPPSLAPVLFKFQWDSLWSLDLLIVVFTFLFVDLFDTAGTLIGVAAKADMLDEHGQPPRVQRALLADAVGHDLWRLPGHQHGDGVRREYGRHHRRWPHRADRAECGRPFRPGAGVVALVRHRAGCGHGTGAGHGRRFHVVAHHPDRSGEFHRGHPGVPDHPDDAPGHEHRRRHRLRRGLLDGPAGCDRPLAKRLAHHGGPGCGLRGAVLPLMSAAAVQTGAEPYSVAEFTSQPTSAAIPMARFPRCVGRSYLTLEAVPVDRQARSSSNRRNRRFGASAHTGAGSHGTWSGAAVDCRRTRSSSRRRRVASPRGMCARNAVLPLTCPR